MSRRVCVGGEWEVKKGLLILARGKKTNIMYLTSVSGDV